MEASNLEEYVDLAFPLAGRLVHEDHGYAAYAALCREVPEFHGADWLSIHPIRGARVVGGRTRLTSYSRLTLRLPLSLIGVAMPLVGKVLDLRGCGVRLRPPTIAPLEPSASLDARTVCIKLTGFPRHSDGTLDKAAAEPRFCEEVERQLARIGVRARLHLRGRRETVVDQRRVLGWSVRLTDLEPAASLLVQRLGVGGKRRMGCGVFVPTLPPAVR